VLRTYRNDRRLAYSLLRNLITFERRLKENFKLIQFQRHFRRNQLHIKVLDQTMKLPFSKQHLPSNFVRQTPKELFRKTAQLLPLGLRLPNDPSCISW